MIAPAGADGYLRTRDAAVHEPRVGHRELEHHVLGLGRIQRRLGHARAELRAAQVAPPPLL